MDISSHAINGGMELSMNVLLVNPSYPQTFWSFDNVLKLTGKKALIPPLGLLTVAALLPQTWNFRLVDLVFESISEDDWRFADIVAVTGMMVQYKGILETIKQGKQRGKTVVVGGPWAFHFPEDALEAGADLVVVGEAESTMPECLNFLAHGESGKIIRSNVMADMEQSPTPRFDLADIDSYVDMAVQFSRGCPFKCEFCDITLMLGRRVRTKTPAQILDELNVLRKLGWRRSVFFVDDNFIGNVMRAKHLLTSLLSWNKSHGWPMEFYTQASVNLAAQEQVLGLMSEAGFSQVFLGIETPDEESLRRTGKKQNVATDLNRVCRKINEAGIQIIAGCIIGFDHEEAGADKRLIEFAARNKIPEMFGTLLQAGPGTELWERLEREERLVSCDYDHLSNQTGLINFAPTRPMKEIVDEFINLYEILYDRTFYLERVLQCLMIMKPPLVPKPFQMPYLFEIRSVVLTLFRQGVLYSSRWTFWKSLFTLLRKNPVRLRNFFTYCVRLEHYTEYSKTIGDALREQLAALDAEHEAGTVPAARAKVL